MAKENHWWGTERIRGELLRLGIELIKRSIQKYMGCAMWACDFTVVCDWLFRQRYIFVVLELKRRGIVHASVTQYPTEGWTAPQLREATPGERTKVSDPRLATVNMPRAFRQWQSVLGSKN